MIKPTPNPPETDTPTEADPASPYSTLHPSRLHDAAERALDHYLKPHTPKSGKPASMFRIDPAIDHESLLAHACESMTSAHVMLSDFAALLDPPYRNTALGIAQVVKCGELAVNQALDSVPSPN